RPPSRCARPLSPRSPWSPPSPPPRRPARSWRTWSPTGWCPACSRSWTTPASAWSTTCCTPIWTATRTRCWWRSPTPAGRRPSARSRRSPSSAARPALEQLGSTLIDDVAVPRSRIAAFLDGCDAISAARELTIGVVGHAGDGNMHPTICFDPTDPGQRERAFSAFDDSLELELSLGGTVTGEHGIGSIKVDWLEREVGPVSLSVHRAIKDALDPQGLLNPGKVLRRAHVGDLAAADVLAGRA